MSLSDPLRKAKHYTNLDWLRLIFALSVPFWHAWNETGPPLKGLFFAVPAFLALSGFVVLQSYERSKSVAHFFWKRLLRVGPAFVASFVLVGVLFGARALWPTFQSWYTFGFAKAPSRNSVLWSLSCEEVAYISLAVAYALGVYKRPALLWIGLALALAAGFRYTVHADTPRQLHSLPTAFLIGNLFYVYRDRVVNVKPWIPLVAMLAMVALMPFRGPVPQVQFAHQSLMIASFIWFGVAGPQIPKRLPIDVSYGTYVYHLPILGYIYTHFTHDRWTLMALGFGITLPLALASWLLMEKPILGFKDRMPWLRGSKETNALPNLPPEPEIAESVPSGAGSS